MIPYVGLSYFLLLLYPLAVLVALGVAGRLGRSAVLVVGAAIVLFEYAVPPADADAAAGWRQLACLGAYTAASVAAIAGYAAVRRRGDARWTFRAALALVLAPVVAAKAYPVLRAHGLAGIAAAPAPRADAAGVPSVTAGFYGTFGFVGMSYMLFRVVDVLIALRDGVLRERPGLGELASYLVFAPTISAGPIDRFARFRKDWRALPRGRADYLADVAAGIDRLAQGFLYKFILAYLIHRHLLRPLGTRHGFVAGVEYMYAFSLYLFFDFAGYSAFAIGVGRFFGVHVPENFDAPFRSRSFREMWDRWHISLSWWLRDHVYMRFMLAAGRRKWFGGDRWRAHVAALVLTMGLMGCWHGLEPQYVVYGLYQGSMLVAYDAFGRWKGRPRLGGRAGDVVALVLTFHLFCFGLLIFSGRLFRP